jgi:DNA polymerase-3 subunit beta
LKGSARRHESSAPSPEVITDMELVVRKADLLRELQLFQGIVERKNTIPILANVSSRPTAIRSNCSRPISKSGCEPLSGVGRKKGSLTLPAKKLYEIIKALPETGRADRRGQERRQGRADRFDSRMQTLPREDFPTLPDGTGVVHGDAAARRAEAHGGENAVRDHRRGHAYFLNGALFIQRPSR